MHNEIFSAWSIPDLIRFFGPKIFFSILCGGIIGLEREIKHKPAGMKTNILICLGAALYTGISILISTIHAGQNYYGDPARLAAQIIPGVGFLGGGTIIQSRGTITGLTTAATIWIMAAIGVCIGIGRGDLAVICSITVVMTLVGTNWFEDKFLGRAIHFHYDIVALDVQGVMREKVYTLLTQNNLTLENFDLGTRGDASVYSLSYRGSSSDQKKFMLELWGLQGIKEVKQV